MDIKRLNLLKKEMKKEGALKCFEKYGEIVLSVLAAEGIDGWRAEKEYYGPAGDMNGFRMVRSLYSHNGKIICEVFRHEYRFGHGPSKQMAFFFKENVTVAHGVSILMSRC